MNCSGDEDSGRNGCQNERPRNEGVPPQSSSEEDYFRVWQHNAQNERKWSTDVKDFRMLSTVPTPEDLVGAGDRNLRQNKIDKRYADVNDYLDVQFRLLREDLVRPLREDLVELLTSRQDRNKKKRKSNVKVYQNVRINSRRVNCQWSPDGGIYKIIFDTTHDQRSGWEADKRLKGGAFVCLSSDQFKTMLIGTITERNSEDLPRGITYLSFDSKYSQISNIHFQCSYEMIVSPAYYGAYKNVLKVLQLMDEGVLPFQKYLLNHSFDEVQPPNYLRRRDPRFDFSSVVQDHDGGDGGIESHTNDIGCVTVLNAAGWPTADRLGLEESQYNALKAALTKEFVVIQGPPGTGKTFIGVIIVQLLLNNRKPPCFVDPRTVPPLWEGPIHIVCYTNHALDQFLEEIINRHPYAPECGRIIRIGSRITKNHPSLQQYSLHEIMKEKTREINRVSQEFDRDQLKEQCRILQGADIVATTTTGAANNYELLKLVKPKIVIVEEAAEVLEAHVVSCLTEGCEHLIMIGDHQQLRPKTADHFLATEFSLEVSLFERMIQNKMHFNTLSVQHRMRPEISKLIVPHIYKSLQNHKDVENYEDVAGVLGNVFFLNHHFPENPTNDSKIHSNDHEAAFLARFCMYLLGLGYSGEKITILTTYSGQLSVLREYLQEKDSRGVCITTVDNYQGEENDIVLLSLVRSNTEKTIGFLKTPNRVCVALSRARKGLYIIGNGNLLRHVSQLWRDILDTLKNEGRLVDELPLGCRRHPEMVFRVKSAGDFKNVPECGCLHPCEYRLDCGHVCDRKCHPFHHKQTYTGCSNVCNVKLPCEHCCQETCRTCVEYGSHAKCKAVCNKSRRLCSHLCRLRCCEPCNECNDQCQTQCGHGQLKHPCNKPPELCWKPCRWSCPHYTCRQPCGLPCDRPPCEASCENKVKKCRKHVCVGICGETCPKICRTCDADLFKELEACLKITLTPESRFLVVEPCDHVVEVNFMDSWVDRTVKNPPCALDGTSFLKCPLCSAKVKECSRYNLKLKSYELHLRKAKNRIEDRNILMSEIEYLLGVGIFRVLNVIYSKEERRLKLGIHLILKETQTLIPKGCRNMETHSQILEHVRTMLSEGGFSPYHEDNTPSAKAILNLYRSYLELQVVRLKGCIRGPKLKILDDCDALVKSLTFSDDNGETDFKKLWKGLEKVNERLCELNQEERKDNIKNYMLHLNRYLDLELNASFTSHWFCCSARHVFSRESELDENAIDSNCPSCHPTIAAFLEILQPSVWTTSVGDGGDFVVEGELKGGNQTIETPEDHEAQGNSIRTETTASQTSPKGDRKMSTTVKKLPDPVEVNRDEEAVNTTIYLRISPSNIDSENIERIRPRNMNDSRSTSKPDDNRRVGRGQNDVEDESLHRRLSTKRTCPFDVQRSMATTSKRSRAPESFGSQ